MPGIGNNLYPPILDAFMPAFVRTTPCRVYFSLSAYNSYENIKNVQIIVNNQSTNLSALRSDLYPAGIKITELNIDNSIENDNKYYIVIDPADLVGNIFELNQFYKVQIRFTGIEASDLTQSNLISPWLIENQGFFSEWSTICLIKGIQQPKIELKGFSQNDENTETIFTTSIIDLVGRMYFEGNSNIEKEYLEYYNIQIYNSFSNSLVYNSENIYTNEYNPNEINYSLKVLLEDGIKYKIIFNYFTINGYNQSLEFNFIIIQNTLPDVLHVDILPTCDVTNGRIKVRVRSNVSVPFIGNLIIRRSSSRDNFNYWEDLHKVSVSSGSPLDYTFYDYTVESGILYKYCVQKVGEDNLLSNIVKLEDPIMIELEDAFLTTENMQLNVKFNPSISNYKRNIIESKVDTLGSKYPFIRRNGSVNYREFPISGLITSFCDEEGIFLNKDNIYGDYKEFYDNYNEINNKTIYNDYIYERNFRDKIMDFLYKDDIKLFRSNQEGNILVKLMDINFSPIDTLGRMLYNFSATAYEIDECSVENYRKYGALNLGNFEENLSYNFNKLGQLDGVFKDDILKILTEKFNELTLDDKESKVEYLKWLRLTFNSEPYYIKLLNNGSVAPVPKEETPTQDAILGYIVYINNSPIIVNKKGFYELIEEEVNITSLYFPIETDVLIDYIANVSEKEIAQKKYSKINYYTKIGQETGSFKAYEKISNIIYLKHSQKTDTINRQLLSINSISIESIPGAVIYIKDAFDEYEYQHVIGSTGILELNDPETTIKEFYFLGFQLYQAEGDVIKENEYFETGESADSFIQITDPKEHNVYMIDGKRFIYYNNKWSSFNQDNIVRCPVFALIDYIFEMMIGEYL